MNKIKMKIMDIGYTQNGFLINKEFVEKALLSIKNTPVTIYNQNRSDYTEYNIKKERVIGVIDKAEIIGSEVIADVIIADEHKNVKEYTNWVITLADDLESFVFNSIEVEVDMNE